VYYYIWCSALVVLAVVVWSWVIIFAHNHSQHNQCRTPYAVIHGFVLLMIGIMMPEIYRDGSLIINIRLVASCWFLSLHPTFHDAQSQEPKTCLLRCGTEQFGTKVQNAQCHIPKNNLTAMFNTHDQLEHNYTYKPYFTARVAQLIILVFRVLAGSRGFHFSLLQNKCLQELWDPPSLLVNAYEGFFPQK